MQTCFHMACVSAWPLFASEIAPFETMYSTEGVMKGYGDIGKM